MAKENKTQEIAQLKTTFLRTVTGHHDLFKVGEVNLFKVSDSKRSLDLAPGVTQIAGEVSIGGARGAWVVRIHAGTIFKIEAAKNSIVEAVVRTTPIEENVDFKINMS